MLDQAERGQLPLKQFPKQNTVSIQQQSGAVLFSFLSLKEVVREIKYRQPIPVANMRA